jgi:hypothetical protein
MEPMPTYTVWISGHEDLRPLIWGRKITADNVDGLFAQVTTLLSNENLAPAPHHAWVREDENASRESLLYGFVCERGIYRHKLIGTGTMKAG